MLEAFELDQSDADVALELVLTFEQRKKSRHLAKTQCGKEVGWFLERGIVLKHGDTLKCKDGTYVKVVAAEEAVSDVSCDDLLLLMRAAYHLGNRHVPLQVDKDFLRYQTDHVLDEMVEGLGLTVSHRMKAFNPESGAYSGGHHH